MSILLFHAPLAADLTAAVANGDKTLAVDPAGDSPEFVNNGVRPAAHLGRSCCVNIPVAGNFNRDAGTVMMWFKPDWGADFDDTLGRILWDLRIEHGSVVDNDPSQRWALVYPNPGDGTGRPESTLYRWRLCIATNRNRHIIGTDEKRPDQRTRQVVWGDRQSFEAGIWMHLAITWQPDEGAIYVDGKEDGRDKLPEGLPDKPLPDTMQLGAISSWMNAGACGAIADFRIFDTALTAEEIRQWSQT